MNVFISSWNRSIKFFENVLEFVYGSFIYAEEVSLVFSLSDC